MIRKYTCDAGYPIVTPALNRKISDAEFASLCRLVDEMEAILHDAIPRRGAAETGRSLDAPSNFWAQGFVTHNLSIVAAKDVAVFNHLRFYCYNFSGRRILENSAAAGIPLLTALPAAIDETIAQNYQASAKLLRNYAAAVQGVPAHYRISPPAVMGEVGILVDGVIVNLDTIHYQTSVNGLLKSGLVERLGQRVGQGKRVRLMEIGAGFGALMFHILHLLPGMQVFIVDLPESLVFSAAYLSVARPDLKQRILTMRDVGDNAALDGADILFVPNHLLPDFIPDIPDLDCAINIMSLSEMSREQVAFYADAVSRMLAPDGVFYEQNHRALEKHVDIVPILTGRFPNRHRVRDGYAADELPEIYLDPHADPSLWSRHSIW